MIVLVGRGHDRQAHFVRAIEEFRALLRASPNPLALVIDLREFTNFEGDSRDAWQAAFTEQRHNLTRIVYVGASQAFVRLASAAATILVGFTPHFIDEWDGVSLPAA